jgi:hypothetical protein
MRKSMFYAAVFAAILAFFPVGSPNAETIKKTTKVKKPAIKLIEKYDESTFDLTRTTLPSKYIGFDLSKLHSVLNNQNNITKDEFETTEQFTKRLAVERAKPILGKLTTDDIFAFMIRPETEYDADNRIQTLYIKNSGANSDFKRLDTDDIGIGATNGNILLALTNKYNQFEWNIRNNEYAANEYVQSDIKIRLDNISPDIAKGNKDKIRVLFIVKLVNPHAIKGVNINCTAVELWAYNFDSGNILKKLPLFVNSKPVIITGENPTRDVFLKHYVTFHSSQASRDSQKFASLITPDFVKEDVWGRSETGEEILRKMSEQSKDSSNASTSVLSVKVVDDVATVVQLYKSSNLTMMLSRQMRNVEYDIQTMDTWVKSNGTWLLRRSMMTKYDYTVDGNHITHKEREK